MIPRCSIIIPARDDAEALGRTLEHLGDLVGIHLAEIIVAAAGRAPLLIPGGSARAARGLGVSCGSTPG